MGFLDMRTIILGQVLGSAICAAVAGSLWWHNRHRYQGLFFCFLNFLLQVIGVGLLLLRGILPDLISMVVANVLGMSGLVFLYAGFARFLGKPAFNRLNWGALAVFSGAIYYSSIISPSLPARSLNISFFIFFFCFECVRLMMREVPERVRPVVRPAAYTLMGFGFISVLRIGFILLGHPAQDFFRDNTPDSVLILAYTSLTTLLTFSLFLMVNRRLLADTAADFDRRLDAEKNLDKTEKSFRDLFENMGEGFALHEMIFDAAGRAADYRFLSANKSFEMLTGLRAADIIGRTAMEVIPGLDMDFVRIYGEVVRSGVPVVLERRAEALGKDYRISVYRPFPGQFATVFSDITAVKAAEAELRASEERFQKAFHAAPFLMSMSEIATGRYIEVNDRFCEVSGFSREELIGRTSTEVGWISSELRDKLRLSSNGISLRIPEVTLTAKGGRRVVCSYSFERLPLSGKNIMVGVGEDLTDRKKAEEALKSSEEQFRRVVDNAPDAIFIQSDGKFLYMNSASARLFGAASGKEMLSKDLMELLVPKYRPIVLERIKKQMETGESVPALEEEYFRLDGSTVMVEVTAVPVLFEGKSSHMVFMRDIAARKRAETAMQAAQKLESLGVLAGGIAHDFNNLLTGITGNLSLIRTVGGACGEVPDLVKEAEAACLTAKGLARQLLTFASGGEPLKTALDLTGLVRESVAFSLRGSPVKGIVEAGPEPVCVLADKDQLFQVVNNLVMNAAQAMGGRGAVNVSVSREELRAGDGPALEPGAYARFDVCDGGPGISADMIGKLFDPYFSTKGKGRGLGLAVCRSIVLKHGGHIGVESEQGKGSVFTVYLPWADCGAAVAATRVVKPLSKGMGRVLIMDDEEVVYKALRRMLTSLGYEAEVAINGEKALEAWQAARAAGRPFAAVIMDLTISGGMGGAEAVKKLKELDPSARAIVSSGYADDPIMADYGAHGFLGVLSKPYQLEDLAAIMGKVLG